MNRYLSGFLALLMMLSFTGVANADMHFPYGEITSPSMDEVTFGTINLGATYNDGDDVDDDIVQWAVREGTCNAGVNTVWGNVDGHNDPYTWTLDGETMYFESTLDVSSLDAGQYCFIFNPRDDAGEPNVRETQMFYVVDDYVHGGGHALEMEGNKRKNWKDFSFGGAVGTAGSFGIVGEWQLNLHNVTGHKRARFHTTDVTDINFFQPNSQTCTAAVNFTADGRFNGEEGYTLVFRAGDNDDTVRITITGPDGLVYDSYSSGDFYTDPSSCVGTARTALDTGNITIVH